MRRATIEAQGHAAAAVPALLAQARDILRQMQKRDRYFEDTEGAMHDRDERRDDVVAYMRMLFRDLSLLGGKRQQADQEE